jgi:outer membrane protein OmpA-like peptidoglycan-associated protein
MATSCTTMPAAAARLALLAVALAGCASPPGAPPAAAPPSAPAAPAPAPTRPPAPLAASPLERTQRWLAESYKGTSVVAVLDDDGVLWLEVPLADAFDPGQTTVKPVLELALQRLAASQQRIPGSRMRVAAPTDPGAGPALGDRRAVQIRAQLAGRGVPMQAVRTVPTRQPGRVELQLEAPPRGAL